MFFSPINENVVSNDPMTLVDARLSVGDVDDRWAVALIGKNLTDEDYFSNVVRFTSTSIAPADASNIGNALGYPQPGRSINVQLSVKF